MLPLEPPPQEALAATGLTDDEARRRREAGGANQIAASSTRTVRQIVRDNVATRFNAILGSLLLVTLVIGPFQDASFGFIVIGNALIAIVQELRAKRTLDRLAVVTAPHARAVRSGRVRQVPLDEVVIDDVLDLAPGDQVVVDGVVLSAHSLEVDESLLTGESDPVVKAPGASVLSGSFVVAGSGRARATAVGADAYASRLAEEARRFQLARSELSRGIDRLLAFGTWCIVPAGVVLIIGQIRAHLSVADAMRTSIAGMTAMVPAGLVLLTSVAFAAAVVRLGRREVLVQELPAVETLARVDVVCLDKTGTLTGGHIVAEAVEPLAGVPAGDVDAALAALAAADPQPNATLLAVAQRGAAPAGWPVRRAVPFSSQRKWSAAEFDGRGTWILGSPEVVAPPLMDAGVRARVDALARGGRRVVLLARADEPLSGESLPARRAPAGIVVLGDRLREEARDAVSYLTGQGVRVIIISGDNPLTAAAVAAGAGVPGAEAPVDARRLSDAPDALAGVLEERTVFGHVTPPQKRAMVAALRDGGHVVAMTGDGVNDVLALKDADIGIAMGSGTEATRSVAQLVLLDDDFSSLPSVVDEGRRVIANIENVSRLYVTQTVYAILLALAVGLAGQPFPFRTTHLTIVATFTIGVPSVILALAPGAPRSRPGFVERTLAFALPAGVVTALATYTAYSLALGEEPRVDLEQAQTTAALVLAGIGLWLVTALGRPVDRDRRILVGALIAGFAIVLSIPAVRAFYLIAPPPPIVWLAGVGIVAMTVSVIEVGWRAVDWVRAHIPEPVEEEEEKA